MTDLDDDVTQLGGRYRLGSVLRTGEFFTAYRATDPVLRRDVVVKVVDYPADLQARLEREYAAARRTAALAHHGLVPVLDVAVERHPFGGGRLELVLEYVAAPTVTERLAQQGPMTAKQAAYLGFDLAEALEYLHAHGVAAGVITPDAVLLADEVEARTQARLMDLSTSGVAGDAPGELSPADDVAALGRLLIRTLSGRPAAVGTVPAVPPGTPERLATLLTAMTAPSPADRPDSTRIALDLREVIAHEFGRHRRVDQAAAPEVDEEARLAALQRYDLLDTPPEGAFDRITGIAARTFGMPISTVSIVDRDRIWFKSHHGIDAEQIDRDPGLCAQVVATGRRIHIPDGSADPLASGNPLIAGDLGLRFYAGVPLTSSEGYTLGALSVCDYRPREVTEQQLELLDELGTLVTHELEMRLAARRAILSRE